MQQQPLANILGEDEEPCEEFRTARTELLLPPTLKKEAQELAKQHDTALNELVVRCLEAGLKDPEIIRKLDEAATARRRRFRLNKMRQMKEGSGRAA